MSRIEIRTTNPEGREVLVIETRRQINTSTLSGPSSMLGLPDYRLADGSHVNRLDDSTFSVVQTGVKLRRIT